MTNNPTIQPKLIAFEGGPCGGKTTIIKALGEAMLAAHRPFVVLPEAAGECINELPGGSDEFEYIAAHDRPAFMDFETQVMTRIIERVHQARQTYANTNTIIAADRLEIASYVQPEEYTEILQRLHRPARPLRDEADTVMYLPSLAHHEPELYERLMAGNSSRYERTAVQARITCQANFEVIRSHRDVRVYEGNNLAHKTGQVIAAVMRLQDAIVADAVQ